MKSIFTRKMIGQEKIDSNNLYLSQIDNEEIVTLSKIDWGKKFKSKLHDMGLTQGTKVKVLRNGSRGSVIINVRGSKLALGRGIVSKIEVERAS